MQISGLKSGYYFRFITICAGCLMSVSMVVNHADYKNPLARERTRGMWVTHGREKAMSASTAMRECRD